MLSLEVTLLLLSSFGAAGVVGNEEQQESLTPPWVPKPDPTAGAVAGWFSVDVEGSVDVTNGPVKVVELSTTATFEQELTEGELADFIAGIQYGMSNVMASEQLGDALVRVASNSIGNMRYAVKAALVWYASSPLSDEQIVKRLVAAQVDQTDAGLLKRLIRNAAADFLATLGSSMQLEDVSVREKPSLVGCNVKHNVKLRSKKRDRIQWSTTQDVDVRNDFDCECHNQCRTADPVKYTLWATYFKETREGKPTEHICRCIHMKKLAAHKAARVLAYTPSWTTWHVGALNTDSEAGLNKLFPSAVETTAPTESVA